MIVEFAGNRDREGDLYRAGFLSPSLSAQLILSGRLVAIHSFDRSYRSRHHRLGILAAAGCHVDRPLHRLIPCTGKVLQLIQGTGCFGRANLF